MFVVCLEITQLAMAHEVSDRYLLPGNDQSSRIATLAQCQRGPGGTASLVPVPGIEPFSLHGRRRGLVLGGSTRLDTCPMARIPGATGIGDLDRLCFGHARWLL